MSSRRKPLRRKPLWRWEPAAYILLFLLLFATSAVQAAGAELAFWIFLALTGAFILALVLQMVTVARNGPGNPDASGNLTTLAGLGLISVAASDAAETRVADTRRHHNAIDAARAFGGDTLSAVLVPHATRWLGRRFRVAVHLVSGERIFHAGFLPSDLDDSWNALLYPLRQRAQYLRVPASVTGDNRPFTVGVDLGSASVAVAIANGQNASR